jgi:hypothetical protein
MPLNPNVWPKTRNGKKIHHPGMFKLSILEAILLTPLNIPPLRYGWIYCLLLGLPYNRKQYEITISNYLA